MLIPLIQLKRLQKKVLKVGVFIIRKMIEKKEVKSVSWCDHSSQLADSLTKSWHKIREKYYNLVVVVLQKKSVQT